MRGTLGYILAAGMLLAFGGTAEALINPNFTPVDLIADANLIAVLKIAPADAEGLCKVEVQRVLKGKLAAKALTLDTSKRFNPAHGQEVKKWITKLGDDSAILFVGAGERGEPIGMVHLGGKWVAVEKAEGAENAWNVGSISVHMEATWAGGTDMLLRLTELILKTPETAVPSAASSGWEEPVKIGAVPGKVSAAVAVNLAGDGQLTLYVASDAGDKVFAFDRKAKKFEDLTAKLKLAAKSRVAAWGDFNADGRIDLASSDGKTLTLWLQSADSSFAPTAVAEVPKAECLGLTAMDAGVTGRAGLLWSSASAAVLLVPDKDKPGLFAQKPLAPGAVLKEPGLPGKCLVADFDGDSIPDVIWPFAKTSLFFKGKGNGEFAEAVTCPLAHGGGRTAAVLGDFDADGRIDVFTMSEDGCGLWQNLGDGKFVDNFPLCGELTYISKPDAIGGNVCNINNSGLQGLFICYANITPQIFFNRGFRSFGHAHAPVDLGETNALPAAMAGQQAGVVADFTGSGVQDMALVLLDGSVHVLRQSLSADSALAIRAAVAPGGPFAGPLTVNASDGQRSLGAWVLSPGVGEAFIGQANPGEITLTWKLPGSLPSAAPQKKAVILMDKPVRVVLQATP